VTVTSLGSRTRGTIEEVHAGGRRLLVVTEDGAEITFALSRATGQFVRDGDQTGARLSFDEPEP
jgi:hypothetical protein